MNLTKSLKNRVYAKRQGQRYILYMPNAIKARMIEATKQEVPIIKDEAELKKSLGSN